MFCYKKKILSSKELKKNENMTPFMTQNVTGSLEVSDLLNDPKGHGDFLCWFDLVFDPKRAQGH